MIQDANPSFEEGKLKELYLDLYKKENLAMNLIQRSIILIAVVLIIMTILFPPFAAGKLPVGENIHSGIGYHPIWNQPTIEYAYEILHGQTYNTATGEDLSTYFVMFNKVGFIIQILSILIISSIMYFIFRGKRNIS